MKDAAPEGKIILYKDLSPQPFHLIRGIQRNMKRRLSDYVFREVDTGMKKRKNQLNKKTGSHSLSSLHHFQTYHRT